MRTTKGSSQVIIGIILIPRTNRSHTLPHETSGHGDTTQIGCLLIGPKRFPGMESKTTTSEKGDCCVTGKDFTQRAPLIPKTECEWWIENGMFCHAGISGVTRATATIVQEMLVLREQFYLFVAFEGVRRAITAPLPLYTTATVEDGTHP